jgi:predicted dehydrogenase
MSSPNSPASPLGIGIIGGGRIASGHAQAVLANRPALALRAIASRAPDRAAELTAKFGGEAMTDWRRLLERADVGAVIIGLPNDEHAEAAIAAAKAGKHVLLEKPMALTLDECDAMIEAARAARVKLFVGHTQHFFAMNVVAHKILASGELGRVVTFTDTWYKPFGLSFRRPWFLDRSKGGGMWMMNGSHMIDRMIWLAGSKVVAVKAWIGNPLLGQQADDAAIAMLQHESGLCSTLVHGGYRVGDERWIGEALCTNGMLKLSTFAPNPGVWVARDDAGYQPVPYEDRDSMAAEVEAFAACIRDGGPEPVTPEHARHVMQVLLAAEESARRGREVVLA